VLNLLTEGFTPRYALAVLEAQDSDFEYRQLGIVDRAGTIGVHTGRDIGQWAGHATGPQCVAFGNGLARPQVVEGILGGFMAEPDGPLEERLLRAIEGGRDAGGQASNGQPRPERSAWLCVVDRSEHPLIDVRVDLHDRAVSQLRRVFEACERSYPQRDTR
jgi:uncharacterized Ntn-hydrolase superfamily protein